MTCGENN
jgi:hypothetical protein